MTLPRVFTESLGGSALTQAVQRGTVPGGGAQRPMNPEEWREQAASVRARFSGDAWLTTLAPALGAGAKLPALRDAAAQGLVVTTGQQAGLFGGPMLTLVKALSARAFADAIERSTGMRCSTVFWAATDDADFVEAASVQIPGTGDAQRLSLTDAPPQGTPMAAAKLAGVRDLLKQMERSCGSDGDGLVARLREAYRDGATIGGAYVEFLRGLLEPLGIAVLDASHPAVRGASRAFLAEALRRSGAISHALVERDKQLRAAGLDPQVATIAELSLVFAYENGLKRRIPVAEADAIAGSGTELGPTVLLRPVLEAALLPTVAYVGGPGELAYFAQVATVASSLGVPTPAAVPRWSTTIVEPAIDRILSRYSVVPHDLRDVDALITRLTRERMPESLSGSVAELRQEIARVVAILREQASAEHVDSKIIDGLRAQLELRVDRGERRLVAALKRRETDLRRDLGTAHGALYPSGVRQERALSFVPYVARYGMPLIERMLVDAGAHATTLVGTAAAARAVAAR